MPGITDLDSGLPDQSAYSMTYSQAKAILERLDYDPNMMDTEEVEDEEFGMVPAGEKQWFALLDTLPRCMMPVIATAIRIFHGQGVDPLGLVGNHPPAKPFPRSKVALLASRIVPPLRNPDTGEEV